MKKILIIEDDCRHQEEYRSYLWDKVELFQAYTAQEAMKILDLHGEDIDYVWMDFYLDEKDHTKNTIELTLHIKQKFKKIKIIAASWHKESREVQMWMLRCDMESEKDNLAVLIEALINDKK
ncbi:MAG: hypothetical protein ACD_2C00194G0004 [uncultured bacterium (gcode 4)]|uniref:Response regulatory domain-containing protein n=1 Tax=uncultured bacterium (gcode 4) TaxID=1234023 RepID=K2G4L7_9BACT|nr:MAG: hypothetical protein ACD_2C00194G0004 [uncultured bacterium (gcode 4)]